MVSEMFSPVEIYSKVSAKIVSKNILKTKSKNTELFDEN
jgi:hypothetical protein